MVFRKEKRSFRRSYNAERKKEYSGKAKNYKRRGRRFRDVFRGGRTLIFSRASTIKRRGCFKRQGKVQNTLSPGSRSVDPRKEKKTQNFKGGKPWK